MPHGEETQFTMTITRRIDGHDYIAGKQFDVLSRGLPYRTADAMGNVALELMERIDESDTRTARPTKHS